MDIRVLLLGPLSDLAARDIVHIDIAAGQVCDWTCLLGALPPALAAAVAEPRVRIACDGEVLREKTSLAAAPGAEIALLPPVSGG